MNEVIPGIYRFQTPLPRPDVLLGYINSYIVRGTDGLLMVDTGWNTDVSLKAVEDQLAEIGNTVKDISQIVITHIHPDHYGLVGRLKELSHAKVYIHRVDTQLVQNRYVNMEPLLEKTRNWLIANGVPPETVAALQNASVALAMRFVLPVAPDVQLEGDEIISTGMFNFKVIWTPGHSQGHICLYEPDKKVLFSGDTVLPHISPNIGLHPQSGGNPVLDYLTSLRELSKYDIEMVLPGHELPFSSVRARLEQLIRHHEERTRDILAQLTDIPKTGYQIAKGMPWHKDVGGSAFDKLGPLDQRLAVLETVAHLEYMRSQKTVIKTERDGLFLFQKA